MSSLDAGLWAGWPLRRAAFGGQVSLIESLVTARHDPNTIDDDGWTPLFLPRTEAAVRTLLRLGADPAHVTEAGETVLMAAARIGSPDAATISGQTALDAAVREGHADVQAILERPIARPSDPR